MVFAKPKGSFYMQYTPKHYYQVKVALVLALCDFKNNPPKDDFEWEVQRTVRKALYITQNKIDELDGTNKRLMEYYRENIEKYRKV